MIPLSRGLVARVDEADYAVEARRLAPSWRRVCKTLLRNDYWGKGLGFTQHKSDAYQKYLDLMRRRRASWGIEQQALGFAKQANEEIAEDHA